MELREYAEQVLFATTLEAKLQSPRVVTDERPGAAFVTPESPGRPPELHFKPAGIRGSEFPGIHRLERTEERGRLLHFFCNHELLATELMALVLLRFPDAPPPFRRGVLQTLKDEQRHTRLYLDRLRECGLQFGELPVSGYFWRAVSPMANPLDFVAGLSLTFEQANLDFARQFSEAFAVVGDGATARLLDGIYRDEIAHVAHGLKWFRRWKEPGLSDWEALCRQLKFPLSPSRAKGGKLNVEGRRAAGLEPEFIDELNVHSQSKGRTPTVWVFNPLTEGYIAGGPGFTPVKAQAELIRDLANLPQFLGRPDDVLLVPRRPSVGFLSELKRVGFPLPEFVELDLGSVPARSPLRARKLGGLRPWAWGPDSVTLLEHLFQKAKTARRTAAESFNPAIAELYSKVWSADFLRRVLPQFADRSWLCAESEVGVTVDSLDAALTAIASIRARGHFRVVVKAALGLAGQGMIRLWEPEILEQQRRWIAVAVEGGRKVVVEPWLERVADFSVQLELDPGGLRLRGYTGLSTDARGQYEGNWVGGDHGRKPPAPVTESLHKSGMAPGQVAQLYDTLRLLLEPELRATGYLGPVGLDAFVYRTPTGICHLKPIVEMNPRYTMGRLTLELMARVCPGSGGRFRLVRRASAQAEGFADFSNYTRSLVERDPVRLAGEPVPRIQEGVVVLNDPSQASGYLAILEVHRSVPVRFDRSARVVSRSAG